MDRIRVQDDVIVFLKAIGGIGLHDRILFVLVIDGDLPEIGIPLIDIVDTDELRLLAKRELVRRVGAVKDRSCAQNAVVEIITVLILAVRNRRNEWPFVPSKTNSLGTRKKLPFVIELLGTLRPVRCPDSSSISRNLSEQNSDIELVNRRLTK